MKSLVFLLLAMMSSGIAILAYDILPTQTLVLIPGDTPVSLFKDSNGSTATWLDRDSYHFRCTYPSRQASYKFCGLDLALGTGEKGLNGIDLSNFARIKLRMEYRGEAKVLRVYARHAITDSPVPLGPDKIMKYNNVFIPVNDLKPELDIRIDEFSVAEWWLRSARLPREDSHVEFGNIVNIGVDAPYPAPDGDHEFVIRELTLSGPYIERENWYLCVMGVWFLLLITRSLKRYQLMNYQIRSKQHLLENALDRSHVLEEETQHYKELSLIDPLTNIYNRRGITQLGEQLAAGGRRGNVTAIMLDVDFLKRINDLYGYDMGDDILIRVASALVAGTRSSDKVGRWGGEEFLVLCPDTNLTQAMALTRHLMEDLHKIETPDGENITVSIGVARPEKYSLSDAILQADKALYDAKNQGRNRVCVFEEVE